MKKITFLFAFLGFIAFPIIQLQAQQVVEGDIVGDWYDADTNKINVFKINDKFIGKIVELHKPYGPDGKPLLDIHNPIDSLKTRKVQGIMFLRGCKFDGNGWKDGDKYNYHNGKTFKRDFIISNPIRKDTIIILDSGSKTSHWTKKKPN